MNAAARRPLSRERQAVVRLHALWGEFWKAAGPTTAEESRIARLHYIASIVGRDVASANDLQPQELAAVTRRLQSDIEANHRSRAREQAVVSSEPRPQRETSTLPKADAQPAERHSSSASSTSSASNVLNFPNRSGISKRMLWKIRQVEHYLGWHTRPLRLERLLEEKFKTRRPEHLSHAQAWRAVEMLMAVAARERVKAERGPDYKVGKAELDAARDQIKQHLDTWRPPELRSEY